MSLLQAQRASTLDAACIEPASKPLGRLEPDKWAGFVLIDQGLSKDPPRLRGNTQVLQTWVAGLRISSREE